MKNQPKIILISFLGLIIAGGLFLFLIRPTVDKVADLNGEVSSKQTDLKQLVEQIDIYRNSQRDLSQAAGKEIISKSLLPRENLQEAIIEIETASATTNTSESLTIVDDGGVVSKGSKPLISGKSFLDEVQYNIKTTSDFGQFVTFLQYLEHLPHFTEISKFSIQSSTGSPDSKGIFVHDGTVVGSIDSVFFVQKK